MASPTTAGNWSKDMRLDDWVERELTPHLAEVFSRHPRFRGESLQFVGLHDNEIVEEPDELTGSIVRRLQTSLQTTPGVHLWWPPRVDEHTACTARAAPDYRIALEFVRLGSDRYRLVLRALDVAERHWVSGFGIEWQGTLSRSQRSALASRPRGDAAPGQRSTPFTPQQADLLARALAQDLHGELCGWLGDPVALYLDPGNEPTPLETRVRQLLGHNLTAGRDVVVVEDPVAADLHLTVELVEIDGDLHQVWVRGRPAKTDSSLIDVNAQAYVHVHNAVDEQVVPESHPRHGRELAVAGKRPQPPALALLQVVVPPDPRHCKSVDPWRFGKPVASASPRIAENGCFALDLKARDDVKVFLLSVDAQSRSQRLLPTACRAFGRTRSVLVRGESVQFPVTTNARRPAFRHPGFAGTHSFYAVAATDHAAARRIEAEVARWHDACRSAGNRATARRVAEERLARLHETVAGLGARAQLQRVDVRYVSGERTLAARYDNGRLPNE